MFICLSIFYCLLQLLHATEQSDAVTVILRSTSSDYKKLDVAKDYVNTVFMKELDAWLKDAKRKASKDWKVLFTEQSKDDGLLEGSFSLAPHGFFNTLLLACSNGIPLRLSPHDFWLLITQSIQLHLRAHARSREKIMGKQRQSHIMSLVLPVSRLGAKKSAWHIALQMAGSTQQTEYTRGSDKASGRKLVDLLKRPLDTENDDAAKRLLLFSPFQVPLRAKSDKKPFFDCKIPSISLTGSKEEINEIVNRLKSLKNEIVGFDWYFSRVYAHLSQIFGTYDDPQRYEEFWSKMVRAVGQSSGKLDSAIDGWISDFVAYYHDAKSGILMKHEKPTLKPSQLPYGFGLNEIALQPTEDGLTDSFFVSGFLATRQDEETRHLECVRGVHVVENPEEEEEEEMENSESESEEVGDVRIEL